MDTVRRTNHDSTALWLIAFVVLAFVIALLLSTTQSASQPHQNAPTAQPRNGATANREPVIQAVPGHKTQELNPSYLRRPTQLEQYK